MTHQDEADLAKQMALAQAGDEHAYGDCLRKTASFLREYFSNKFPRHDILEDVIQEVLISIHKARASYDPSRSYRAWVCAIADCRRNDFWRTHFRGERLGKESGAEPPLVTEISLEDPSLLLLNTVSGLSAKQSEIIRLLKFEGKSIRETSQTLGMSESAVKVAAHRAYKALKDLLGKNNAD